MTELLKFNFNSLIFFMRIIYIANVRIPTEKAHGIQIMKTCEALVGAGVGLELWLPKRNNLMFKNINPFEYYHLTAKFRIRYLDCWDTVGKFKFFPGLGFYLESKTFAFSVGRELKRVDHDDLIFYSRDTYPLVPVMKRRLPFFYEIHTLTKNPSRIIKRVFKEARGVVAISKGLVSEVNKYISGKKVFLSPDGVDLSFFADNISKQEARRELGIPEGKKIVLYAGHLYAWKGARILAQASVSLDSDTVVCFVGGTDSDISEFRDFIKRSELDRVKHLGRVKHEEIPKYLAVADVLVLPNSAKFEISKYYTSPLKLFEYMAARRPIVASDLPSLREVLDESMAVFFVPDDPIDLARKIRSVLLGEIPVERLAVNAHGKVQKYSWSARSAGIISFIKKMT